MVNERKDYISIVILFVVNLINNVDRYTIAGVLPDVQSYYNINDSMGGMIQTVFLISFMIGSPICGYLGDRFNRKYVMLVGIVIWLICVCASTFIPRNLFPLFLFFRSLVGIGEASYVNICPTMISDMFTSDKRTRVYMLFYLAVPVGSGLGYIISSNVSSLTGSWQWGVRVTGIGGIVALLALLFMVHEPERGAAEKLEGKDTTVRPSTSYWKDLKVLLKCPTYVVTTLAYTALIFVSGTLTWWMPTIIEYSAAWTRGYKSIKELPLSFKNETGLIFGLLTTACGIIGTLLGNLLAQCFLYGWLGAWSKTKRAHLVAAGCGALISTPCLVVVFVFGHSSELLTWIMVGVSITGLCFNWSLNVEVFNQIVAPERRSTAFSYVTLISHLCGDASGPYIIGAISDAIKSNHLDSPEWDYKSLAYASMLAPVMMGISTVLYFVAAIIFKRDARRLVREMTRNESDDQEKSYTNGIWADDCLTHSSKF
ncbi:Major facilitator superfamily (MFS) profile domain-containing protein [Caenorhabditis elegans]|uniref:Major facilitator superfamily (MFS) profile domain-containing protein n=1 Tax=Caenorhabditis elegans TaxID=6239 RepID=Q19235_CAEEL|nr:Major facilitator superfamily (MFS) profile domain-containing protein [Caenorhabditis elegans]CAA93644.3 Major facilitator superfamily (MFS) profile domain-containing protein [Caenorhabditis elegans]|eukprot:NP_510181.3 SPINster (Drosophila lysosomal permease) homolog [Caenorhabditis elegans]